jgi:hypothetical protein
MNDCMRSSCLEDTQLPATTTGADDDYDYAVDPRRIRGIREIHGKCPGPHTRLPDPSHFENLIDEETLAQHQREAQSWIRLLHSHEEGTALRAQIQERQDALHEQSATTSELRLQVDCLEEELVRVKESRDELLKKITRRDRTIYDLRLQTRRALQKFNFIFGNMERRLSSLLEDPWLRDFVEGEEKTEDTIEHSKEEEKEKEDEGEKFTNPPVQKCYGDDWLALQLKLKTQPIVVTYTKEALLGGLAAPPACKKVWEGEEKFLNSKNGKK